MDEVTIRVFSIIILLITLIVVAVPIRRKVWLRKIEAFSAVPSFRGLALEASQPVHVSLGSAGIGGSSTLLALAGAEFAYHMSEHVVMGDVPPLITLSDPSAIPIGQDALRRAYHARGLSHKYRPTSVHWYPAGNRSVAFAAALTSLMSTDRISSNVLTGSYGPELALLLFTANRNQISTIAVSDQLEGQAIAFALADYRLIGEEAFVASSYLSNEGLISSEADSAPGAVHKAVAIDVLRWLLVAALLAGFGLKLVGEG